MKLDLGLCYPYVGLHQLTLVYAVASQFSLEQFECFVTFSSGGMQVDNWLTL